MKKHFTYALLISLFGFILLSKEIKANIPEKNSIKNGYVVKKQESVKGLFDALSTQLGKPIVLSKKAATKYIGSGDFVFYEPLEIFHTVLKTLNLIDYSDNNIIYVFDVSEIKSIIIQLNYISAEKVKAFLVQAKLYDARYPLQGDNRAGLFYLSAPPTYIDTVTKIIQSLDMPSSLSSLSSAATSMNERLASNDNYIYSSTEKVALVKLHNTFVQNREYKGVLIEGIASVLNALLTKTNTNFVLQNTPASSNNTNQSSQYTLPSLPHLPGLIETEQSKTDKVISPELPKIDSTLMQNINLAENPVIIIPDVNNNSLLIKGSDQQIELIRTLIKLLDKPKRHIELSLWIIDVTKSFYEEYGVNWNFNLKTKYFSASLDRKHVSATVKESLVDNSQLFLANLKAHAGKDQVNIVSRPSVLTQEYLPARMQDKTTLNKVVKAEKQSNIIPLVFGTEINVLPRFTENNDIEMILSIEDGNQVTNDKESQDTTLKQTKIETIARVPQNKSLLIGGNTRETVASNSKKVPFLGDIPGLGALFRSKTKNNQQVVRLFLIEPREINSPVHKNEIKDVLQEKPNHTKLLNDWVKNYFTYQG